MTCQQPTCAVRLIVGDRQAHVVPLSSSIPQVNTGGEKSTPGSVASFCSVYQPCSCPHLRREGRCCREKVEFCLCSCKCCTIEKVLNFMARAVDLLSSWYE